MPEQVIRNRPREPEMARAPGQQEPPRQRTGFGPGEDPLDELARIVGETVPQPRVAPTAAPDPAARRETAASRREYPRRDTSWRDPYVQTTVRAGITPQPMPGQLEELEAELYSELRNLAPVRGSAEVRRELDLQMEDPREAATQIMPTQKPRQPSNAVAEPAANMPLSQARTVREPRRDPAPVPHDDEVTLPMNAVLRNSQAARPPVPPAPDPFAVSPEPRAAAHEPAYATQPSTYAQDADYGQHYDHDPAGAMRTDDYAPYAAAHQAAQPFRDDYGYDAPEPQTNPYDDTVSRQSSPGYAPGPDIHAQLDRRPARPARRGLTVAAMAVGVITLAAVGFVGYRAVAGNGLFSAGLPLIKADPGPMKEMAKAQPIVASGPNLDATRTEDPGKLVSRQEDPVDQVPGKPPVRIIGTNTTTSSPPQQKMVHSVIVHTDGSMTTPDGDTLKPPTTPVRTTSISTNDAPAPTPAPAPVATAPAPVLTAPAPVAVKPVAVEKPAVAATPSPAPAAPKPVTTVAIKPVKPVTPPETSTRTGTLPPPKVTTSEDGPLSLAPSGPAPKVAAATPPPAPVPQPAAAPVAPRALVSDAGSAEFMVQISSQRSDAEARKALQDATRKFSALGVKGGDVQQADLGARGTYYRARLAAGSREQAVALCSQIKAQGGDCVVAKR